MMRVYLIRHGQPVSTEMNPERPLSDRGKNDVEKIAESLYRAGVKIDEVLHSGKSRARQTAAIVASRLNPKLELQESPGLGPLDDVTRIANQIKEAEKDLLIAGHMPHLGRTDPVGIERRVAAGTAGNHCQEQRQNCKTGKWSAHGSPLRFTGSS